MLTHRHREVGFVERGGVAEAGVAGVPFERQGRHGDAPAIALSTDPVRVVHTGVVEEDLVEGRIPGHLTQRPHLDTGLGHVDQEVGDASVFGGVGIGAGDQDPVLRIVSARVPDLLPGDGPLIAILHRAGAERGHVRAGRRFREELAPRCGAVDDAREVALLLLGRTHDEECRRDEEGGDAVRRPVGADGTASLLDGLGITTRQATTAEALGPLRERETCVGEEAPPVAQRHRRIPVLLEPFGRLGRDVGHVHPAPACQERLSARQRRAALPSESGAATCDRNIHCVTSVGHLAG